jgi:hypothetical protein
VEKARRAAVIPVIGDSRRVGSVDVTVSSPEDARMTASLRSHAQRQTVKLIADIRAGLDKIAVPVLKEMSAASDTAKEMALRHYDKYSVLRRARGTTSGFMESTQLRAFYAEMLENVEPRELAAFAQQSIDTGDPILADAVQRVNFTIPRSDRSFTNQAFLALLNNSEFDEAQAMLATVTMLHEAATVQYATFGRESGAVSLKRMAYGLNYGNVKLNEDGSIDPRGVEAG